MAQPVVVFESVWKRFKRGEHHDSLRDFIPSALGRLLSRRGSAWQLQEQEFWAVRDVSFELAHGEALGIVGPNGAGKSTILKLLTRILKPTAGRCEVRGRVGALIEVAAGFHPDLTGRENVFLQGAIMGMKRAETARRFDEIVEFAGVSDFIDTQVKRYSSGMNARLGFAIAAHLNPDVLLIDEVLSVGDAAFQERCLERMRDLIRRGTPIVFVSHNLPAVLNLCTRAIVIDHGAVRFDGEPAAAIQEYRARPTAPKVSPGTTDAPPIRIVRAELLTDVDEPSAVFHTTGSMRVRIHYDASQAMQQVSFAVDIHRADGIYCVGMNTLADRRDLGVLIGTGHVDLVLPRLSLLPGCYLISIRLVDGRAGTTLDVHSRAYPCTVLSDCRDAGLVYLDHDWRHRASPRESRLVWEASGQTVLNLGSGIAGPPREPRR